MAQRIHPVHTNPELARKLEDCKNHVLTKEEYQAQRRSWAIGNIALDRPDEPIEDIAARVDKSIEKGY